ncbi:phosphotransferase family protein [Streptomyces johnsoniae]|uniref:Aminoglycoside phosphotransferase family protein n=1 Tax=Streptomyces johnsoniae TaxID=3075532 RepID=A0ABU2RYY0_9ACTN|nr:aminoglycoside phosphotransferase family protein [Streptomyces sp. DSM 41886]MDT0441971.1 aminoglycoside phosphotransferase family protein [Streptomyces sp. DSM 41886]
MTAAATVTPFLEAAGIPAAELAGCEPLTGGTYNTLLRVRLRAGTRLVLKLPPPREVPALAYERDLLRGEVMFYRAAAGVGVPVPEVVAAGDGFVLMTECAGTGWHQAPPPAADRDRLRRALGELAGRLHTVTGPRFGYPSGAIPAADGWRGTFLAMLSALLDDAERYAVRLPVPAERIRALASAAAPALDEVTVPVLVHFDLWDGNVLIDGGEISALIDGERMMWGDPLAELTSLNLLGGPEDDAALLAGYAVGGGRTAFDEAAHLRMALYRCYLYLIMLIEAAPRGYGADRHAMLDARVKPALRAALDRLAP